MFEFMDRDGALAHLSIQITRITLTFSIGAIAVLTNKSDRIVSAFLLKALVLQIDEIVEMAQPKGPAMSVINRHHPPGQRDAPKSTSTPAPPPIARPSDRYWAT